MLTAIKMDKISLRVLHKKEKQPFKMMDIHTFILNEVAAALEKNTTCSIHNTSTMRSSRPSSVFCAALVATVSLNNARGDFEPRFIPSELGCSTAHCDVQMTDNGNMRVPEGNVGILWTDEKPGTTTILKRTRTAVRPLASSLFEC
jgi:hypothetical protein